MKENLTKLPERLFNGAAVVLAIGMVATLSMATKHSNDARYMSENSTNLLDCQPCLVSDLPDTKKIEALQAEAKDDLGDALTLGGLAGGSMILGMVAGGIRQRRKQEVES